MKVLTDLVFEIYMIIFLDNMLLASWLKLKQIISPKMLNNLKETCRARAILVLDITETVLGLKEHRSSFKVVTLTVKNKQKATAESENYLKLLTYNTRIMKIILSKGITFLLVSVFMCALAFDSGCCRFLT